MEKIKDLFIALGYVYDERNNYTYFENMHFQWRLYGFVNNELSFSLKFYKKNMVDFSCRMPLDIALQYICYESILARTIDKDGFDYKIITIDKEGFQSLGTKIKPEKFLALVKVEKSLIPPKGWVMGEDVKLGQSYYTVIGKPVYIKEIIYHNLKP